MRRTQEYLVDYLVVFSTTTVASRYSYCTLVE